MLSIVGLFLIIFLIEVGCQPKEETYSMSTTPCKFYYSKDGEHGFDFLYCEKTIRNDSGANTDEKGGKEK